LNHEGSTILLVSQDVIQALGLAHRGYVLENGRVVMKGTGKDLLGDPEIKKAYLGI
jgi:branched-chain amino acid transport system ATP-binding protein